MKRKDIIKEAVRDFYGRHIPNMKVIWNYLIKRNKPKLTEEQKGDVWHIRANLSDPVYRRSTIKALTRR